MNGSQQPYLSLIDTLKMYDIFQGIFVFFRIFPLFQVAESRDPSNCNEKRQKSVKCNKFGLN